MGGEPRAQRVRDPVHGLIVFEAGNKLDQLAWKLINTPEFQRLRRIRQLGMSELSSPVRPIRVSLILSECSTMPAS